MKNVVTVNAIIHIQRIKKKIFTFLNESVTVMTRLKSTCPVFNVSIIIHLNGPTFFKAQYSVYNQIFATKMIEVFTSSSHVRVV